MVEGATALPLDLYPSPGDLKGTWFLLPQVKSILLTVIILGLLTEIKMAGTGIAGGIALLGATLLFAMSFIGGTGSWFEVMLFIVGIGLLILELFIPGFGVFGVLGIISIFASFYYILGANAMAMNWLAGSVVAALVIFGVLVKYLPSNPAWKLFVLQDQQKNKEGFTTAPSMEVYLGRSGLAITNLRPAGVGDFDGARVDVVTFGEYIEIGTPIFVVKVEGIKVFVKNK